MSDLPYDILRIILSSPQIPCSTRFELQKDKNLGSLTNKLSIDPVLKCKLNRIIASRDPRNHGVGGTCTVTSENNKVSLSMFVDKMHRHVYTFKIRKGAKITAVTYDDLMGDWRTSRTADYQLDTTRFLSRMLRGFR